MATTKPKKEEDKVIPLSPSMVTTVVETNNAARAEKASRVKAAMAALVVIETEEQDKYANDLLVKVRERYDEIEALRKQYSRPIDAWLSDQIAIEREIAAEMDRIRKMRNDYHTKIEQEAKAKRDEIEKKKRFDQHEAEVKGRMKVSVENSIAKKVIVTEEAIMKIVNGMTLESVENDSKQLNFKPSLKREYFDGLFNVEYDKSIMTPEQFANLVTRAKTFWVFETINDKYVEKINEVVTKWKEQIPFRVKELQEVAKGNAAAKEAAEKRIAEDQTELKKKSAEQSKQIETAAQAQVQEESLKADFTAQVQEQNIESSNAQTRRKYRIDLTKENNLMEVSALVAKMIIHLIAEKDHKSIYKVDKDGKPKVDADGDFVYVDGIQFWLDQMSKLGYEVKIPGLVCTEYKSVAARKAK